MKDIWYNQLNPFEKTKCSKCKKFIAASTFYFRLIKRKSITDRLDIKGKDFCSGCYELETAFDTDIFK